MRLTKKYKRQRRPRYKRTRKIKGVGGGITATKLNKLYTFFYNQFEKYCTKDIVEYLMSPDNFSQSKEEESSNEEGQPLEEEDPDNPFANVDFDTVDDKVLTDRNNTPETISKIEELHLSRTPEFCNKSDNQLDCIEQLKFYINILNQYDDAIINKDKEWPSREENEQINGQIYIKQLKFFYNDEAKVDRVIWNTSQIELYTYFYNQFKDVFENVKTKRTSINIKHKYYKKLNMLYRRMNNIDSQKIKPTNCITNNDYIAIQKNCEQLTTIYISYIIDYDSLQKKTKPLFFGKAFLPERVDKNTDYEKEMKNILSEYKITEEITNEVKKNETDEIERIKKDYYEKFDDTIFSDLFIYFFNELQYCYVQLKRFIYIKKKHNDNFKEDNIESFYKNEDYLKEKFGTNYEQKKTAFIQTVNEYLKLKKEISTFLNIHDPSDIYEKFADIPDPNNDTDEEFMAKQTKFAKAITKEKERITVDENKQVSGILTECGVNNQTFGNLCDGKLRECIKYINNYDKFVNNPNEIMKELQINLPDRRNQIKIYEQKKGNIVNYGVHRFFDLGYNDVIKQSNRGGKNKTRRRRRRSQLHKKYTNRRR